MNSSENSGASSALAVDACSAILMDSEGDPSPANNYDGTAVEIEGEYVWVKDLHCPSGCGCGGCQDVWNRHKIGDGRFFWQNVPSEPRGPKLSNT